MTISDLRACFAHLFRIRTFYWCLVITSTLRARIFLACCHNRERYTTIQRLTRSTIKHNGRIVSHQLIHSISSPLETRKCHFQYHICVTLKHYQLSSASKYLYWYCRSKLNQTMSQPNTATMDSTSERSSKVQARLKTIYRKTVLPVEKRFQYDYFYESPFLSDVEFDCEFLSWTIVRLCLLFFRVLCRVALLFSFHAEDMLAGKRCAHHAKVWFAV